MGFILEQEILAPRELMLFEDMLNSGLSIRVKATGRSMVPFLTGGEILTIKKVPSASLEKGDLLFFKDTHGYPVLHRIIRKKCIDNEFVFQTKGDALSDFDEPVSDQSILGKACKIERSRMKYFGQINLESFFWRKVGYLTAIAELIRSKAHSALLKLFKRLRSTAEAFL